MDYKQVIIVRKDLGMRCGKICAQVAHGSLISMGVSGEGITQLWVTEGMRKIILKTNSLDELQNLNQILEKNNIKAVFIKDFGLTQIERGTTTVLAIEILKSEDIDEYIKDFKLL